MPDRLKHVQRGDLIPHDQWNLMVDLHKARARDTGPDRIRTSTGYHVAPTISGGAGAANFQLVIIRRIENDADLEVKIEFAREGRNFNEVGNDDDYGRYVGYHEYARTATPTPDPLPLLEDFLHDARVFCHTTGIGWKGVLWPPIENPEDPIFYRDTHVEGTPIFLAFKPGAKWIILPTFRMWTAKVAASARHHDCVVEG